MTAIFTNTGLTLLATALQTAGANSAIAYIDVTLGCGTLASAISAGAPLTALALDAGLPASLAAGQALTVTDGTHSESVTVAAGGGAISAGATSIPIASWTPSNSYAAHTTGVAPTPQASDLALYNGAAATRVATTAGVAGSTPGESLNSGYFDGTQATGLYLLVGYFGGSTATSSVGSGTLIAEDIQYWSHTLNADSVSFQLDSVL